MGAAVLPSVVLACFGTAGFGAGFPWESGGVFAGVALPESDGAGVGFTGGGTAWEDFGGGFVWVTDGSSSSSLSDESLLSDVSLGFVAPGTVVAAGLAWVGVTAVCLTAFLLRGTGVTGALFTGAALTGTVFTAAFAWTTGVASSSSEDVSSLDSSLLLSAAPAACFTSTLGAGPFTAGVSFSSSLSDEELLPLLLELCGALVVTGALL